MGKGNFRTGPDQVRLCKTCVATAELYRWAFVVRSDDERRRFGYRGIKLLLQSYQHSSRSGQDDLAVKETLDCYEGIARQVARDNNDEEEFQEATESPGLTNANLLEAIEADERPRTLYSVCSYSTAKPPPGSVLPLVAKRGWNEVVVALLELRTNPDLKDRVDRTALSYEAESGTTIIVETLLRYKASPDIQDTDNRTPLSWAAEKGHEAIVKLLIDDARVEPDLKDSGGRTPLSWAAENGQRVSLTYCLRIFESIRTLMIAENGRRFRGRPGMGKRTSLINCLRIFESNRT